jgi:hypothetical protein
MSSYDESFDGGVNLPPDDVPRFAFEEAEVILDEFAAGQDEEFQRSWMKCKFMATAYAYGDYYDGEMHPALALSRGWEELQIAFTGRGEAFLSGAVLHLYCSLPNKRAERAYMKVVKRAFKAAEEATPKRAKRMFMKKYRNAPLIDPIDGSFTLDPVLPVEGVRLRTWALAHQLDADHIEEQFHWLEHADRLETSDDILEAIEEFEDAPTDHRPGRPVLQLLDGGKTTQGTDK